MKKKAIIIGAGPAGLTAALEFLRKTDVVPIVLEASGEIGGISRTIRYKGNRMDIGGHRFFSKSDRVMQWWMDLMPPESAAENANISYQGKQRVVAVPAHLEQEPPLRGLGPLSPSIEEAEPADASARVATVVTAPEPESDDLVMLVRPRKSRIYYLRRFFDYPIKLSGNTIKNLGPARMAKIGASYIASRVRPIKEP
jgi:protoporphyrinogen oxidase